MHFPEVDDLLLFEVENVIMTGEKNSNLITSVPSNCRNDLSLLTTKAINT